MSTQDPTMNEPVNKAALEQDINATREQLVDAADALAERIDPRQVADRTTEQLKRDAQRTVETVRTQAESAQQSAREFVEENPETVKQYAMGAAAVLALWLWVRRRRRRRGDN